MSDQPAIHTGGHAIPDSDDFRAGMAYAAHIALHMVNAAHGHSGWIPPELHLSAQARREVITWAQAFALGVGETAGATIPAHSHPGMVDHEASR